MFVLNFEIIIKKYILSHSINISVNRKLKKKMFERTQICYKCFQTNGKASMIDASADCPLISIEILKYFCFEKKYDIFRADFESDKNFL